MKSNKSGRLTVKRALLAYSMLVMGVSVVWLTFLNPTKLSAQDPQEPSTLTPNIILILADDLGWGDTGFNGNPEVLTPFMDDMATNGLVFDRFYVASPICSPSRASFLTGRHPYRYGILAAHTGGMRIGEITIAEVLKENGYATGFFGKWHLGWVRPEPENSRGFFSPPWHHGFDVSFATTSAVPTWNPTITPDGWNSWGEREGEPWKGGDPYVYYDENNSGVGIPVIDNMEGENSRVIMDRVLPFIENNAEKNTPFLSLIWFHTPHEPVVAGPEYRALYQELDEAKQHYYGAITAMDRQIGRLRDELKRLKIAENTLIFFVSDNGAARPLLRSGAASTGPYRGSKHTMYEGGVRVPALVEWPGYISPARTSTMVSSLDFLPTILNLDGLKPPKELSERPLDGESFKSLLDGDYSWQRQNPIMAGWMRIYRNQHGISLISNRYKLLKDTEKNRYELYDVLSDPSETTDLSGEYPEVVADMRQLLEEWLNSTKESRDGADYSY